LKENCGRTFYSIWGHTISFFTVEDIEEFHEDYKICIDEEDSLVIGNELGSMAMSTG
jgi:hypothetical protein